MESLHRATPSEPTPVNPKKLRRGAKIRLLRSYLQANKHLQVDGREVSPVYQKGLQTIALEVGLQSTGVVSHVIHREFANIAAVLAERDPTPHRPAPKKNRLLRYITEGEHLIDLEGEVDTANLKTQTQIARELGMDQKFVSIVIAENFPVISAMMNVRRVNYRAST